jgi:hypothetical protein
LPTDHGKDLPGLLGKHINDPDVAGFLKKLDSGQAVRLSSLKEPRWISKAAGTEIHAAPKSKRIHTIKACLPRPPDAESDERAAWDEAYRSIVSFGKDGKITNVYLTSDF